MDNSIRSEQRAGPQPPISFLGSLPIVSNIFKWLATLIEPTEEDRVNAGVYLGGEGRD